MQCIGFKVNRNHGCEPRCTKPRHKVSSNSLKESLPQPLDSSGLTLRSARTLRLSKFFGDLSPRFASFGVRRIFRSVNAAVESITRAEAPPADRGAPHDARGATR